VAELWSLTTNGEQRRCDEEMLVLAAAFVLGFIVPIAIGEFGRRFRPSAQGLPVGLRIAEAVLVLALVAALLVTGDRWPGAAAVGYVVGVVVRSLVFRRQPARGT
jgi:hypothetical protein